MRPYLAILKDSFREAMVSRVLWVLLVLATLMLALILPLSLTEDVAYMLQQGHLPDATALAQQIKSEHDGDRPAPGKQIWQLLHGETKQRFENAFREDFEGDPPLAVESYMFDDGHQPFWRDLNEILEQSDLWDEASWADTKLTAETEELLDRGVDQLDEVKLGRLNRLLLEAAYSQHIAPSRPMSLYIAYFGFGPDMPLPWTLDGTVQYWLSLLTEYIAGMVGIIIAILVTSSVIPHTFEAGSIDLLLSKPVSRSLVFLTKFVGGCAFILLLSAYFVGGLWLIAGVRYGYWSGTLLMCIPVLMFLFAVYYSVSALAGLIWKNAIVAVVISVVFWCVCAGIWFIKIKICDNLLAVQNITQIVDTPDGVYVYRSSSFFSDNTPDRWDASERKWESQTDAGLPEGSPRGASLRPIMQGGGRRFFASGQDKFIEVRHDGVYESDEIEFNLAVAFGESRQLSVKVDDAESETDEAPQPEEQEPGDVKQVVENDKQPPRRIGGRLSLASPIVAAMDSDNGDLIVYDRDQLRRLTRSDSGEYDEAAAVTVDHRKDGIVAIGGSTVLLASAEGRIQLYDSATLEPRGEAFQPENKSPPYSAHSSADGRFFAVLFHHGVLWLYDTQQEKTLRGISGQGEISAATFSGDDQLLVAHHFNEVTRYKIDSMQPVEEFRPELETFERVYWYGIRPIYNLAPKPGELGDLVTYLVSGSKSTTGIRTPDDLQSRTDRGKLNVWKPLWINLAYLIALLGLCCLYVQRKDF